MNNLPTKFRNPNPSLSERRLMPTGSMEFWSRETWASWLVDGIRIFYQGNREDRVLAFSPLTLDPDVGEPGDLCHQVRSTVTVPTLSRFEEGLSLALSAWCPEDGSTSATFLVQLAGFVEGVGPRIVLKSMFQKPTSIHLLANAAAIADSVAFVLSRRADVALIRELKRTLEPLLSTSLTAAVIVASREAVEDVSDFAPFLERVASNLFKLSADHSDWRFVVNQLIERAGPEKAIEAAYLDGTRATSKLREALHRHRLEIRSSVGRSGFRTVFDRFRKQTYEISMSYFSGNGIYFYQLEETLNVSSENLFGNDAIDRLKIIMDKGLGDLVAPDTQFDKWSDANVLSFDE
jgi:hypothetical protein